MAANPPPNMSEDLAAALNAVQMVQAHTADTIDRVEELLQRERKAQRELIARFESKISGFLVGAGAVLLFAAFRRR